MAQVPATDDDDGDQKPKVFSFDDVRGAKHKQYMILFCVILLWKVESFTHRRKKKDKPTEKSVCICLIYF